MRRSSPCLKAGVPTLQILDEIKSGYLQNEVGKYFYAERKIYSVLCKKWLKNITTHDMLFHAI